MTAPTDDQTITRLLDTLEPVLQRSILPIAVYDTRRQTMCAHGTGTLFAVADSHFLVTAAHVWKQAQKANYPLFISDSTDKSEAVPLSDAQVVYFDHPVLDVAVVDLPRSVLCAIPNRLDLRLSQVDLRPGDERGLYLLYGWPSELSQDDAATKQVQLAPFIFLTRRHTTSSAGLESYDPKLHILLSIPRAGSVPLRGSRSPRPEDVRGISGCSVWRVYRTDAQAATWQPEDAKIVAVQCSAYRGQEIVKAVRWCAVVALMWENWPDLRNPIRISHPDCERDLHALEQYLRRLIG